MYRHTQFGRTILCWMVPITLLCAAPLLIREVRENLFAAVTFHGTLWALVLATVLFYNLTVTVDHAAVRLYFGIGVVRLTFPLDGVAAVRVVQIKWHHGWGIHWVGTGWVYNVSGWEAVELLYDNGKTVWIGTDDQEGLLQAICAAAPHVQRR